MSATVSIHRFMKSRKSGECRHTVTGSIVPSIMITWLSGW